MKSNNAGIDRERFAGMNIHYYYYPLEYFLDTQLKLGYRTIELWGGTPHVWVDHLSCWNVSGIKKELEVREQHVAVYTPEYSSYRYLLCTADPSIYRKSMEYYSNCIQLTAALNAKIMCINMTGRFRDEDYEPAWERCVESVGRLCDIADKTGIDIAVETLSPDQSCILTKLEELKRLYEIVKSKRLKIALDTVSIGASGETIDQWFDAFGRDIVHVHFTDGRNDGSHLVWGEGCFPLERYLHKLNERGYEGVLSPNLSFRKYFNDPVTADVKNRNMLSKVL